jgi:hypothetical protein
LSRCNGLRPQLFILLFSVSRIVTKVAFYTQRKHYLHTSYVYRYKYIAVLPTVSQQVDKLAQVLTPFVFESKLNFICFQDIVGYTDHSPSRSVIIAQYSFFFVFAENGLAEEATDAPQP